MKKGIVLISLLLSVNFVFAWERVPEAKGWFNRHFKTEFQINENNFYNKDDRIWVLTSISALKKKDWHIEPASSEALETVLDRLESDSYADGKIFLKENPTWAIVFWDSGEFFIDVITWGNGILVMRKYYTMADSKDSGRMHSWANDSTEW